MKTIEFDNPRPDKRPPKLTLSVTEFVENKAVALMVTTPDGEPWAKLSVNLPGMMGPDCINAERETWIRLDKDLYGLAPALESAGYLQRLDTEVENEFSVRWTLFELTDELLKQLGED